MKKTFRKLLVLSFLLTVSLPGLAETPATSRAQPSLRMTLRVYDYAQVAPKTLARALREARTIFRKARVETVWLVCLGVNGLRAPACQDRLRPTELVLRVIRRTKAARAAFGQDTIGYAVRSEDGSGGILASVFYDYVEDVAFDQGFDQEVVLGHALAHELAHLLLPSGDHSPKGLMRAYLRRKDWQRAAMGRLLFTPEQAELIQAGVLALLSLEETFEPIERAPAE